jgi:hypothetical protein
MKTFTLTRQIPVESGYDVVVAGGGLCGAIVGTIFIPIPVVATIGGAVLGAFSGATLMEMISGKDREGAALGHVTGNLTKFGLGCVIWLIITIGVYNA